MTSERNLFTNTTIEAKILTRLGLSDNPTLNKALSDEKLAIQIISDPKKMAEILKDRKETAGAAGDKKIDDKEATALILNILYVRHALSADVQKAFANAYPDQDQGQTQNDGPKR